MFVRHMPTPCFVLLCAALLLPGTGAGCTADTEPGALEAGSVTTERLLHAGGEPESWFAHGGTHAEDRHSRLDQIDRESVQRLGLAWSHDFNLRGGVEATPLMAGGVLYVSGPWSTVEALDARSGTPLWRYDPEVPRLRGLYACCDVVNRGVALHEDRVFVGTLDGRLVALDAATGAPVWEVVTTENDMPYTITGAPRVVDGLIIIGNGGAEYPVRGYISAYASGTGALVWRTYTVPGNPADGFESEALERAAESWSGEWWLHGGGGTAWDAMAYDPELDLLYVGTGNGSPWSREVRSPGGGDNLYLSSILALRPSDGSLVWHYQTTPGDNWDFTATQPMILADLEINGRLRKTIMQAPKNGFFYVLDRETGDFISGENYVRVNWADGIDPVTARPREQPIASYHPGPSGDLTPWFIGGHNWQSMSFNPETGLTYFPVHEGGVIYSGAEGPTLYEGIFSVGTGAAFTMVPMGFLLAWDPVAQEEAWRIPLANWWNGGTLSTAGGIVFQGGGDGRFVGYDAESGEVLWEFSSGLGIIAAPISYELDGVQYVTVAAGWGGAGGRTNAPSGEAEAYEQRGRLMTFALDRDTPRPPLVPRSALPDLGALRLDDLGLTDDAAALGKGEQLYALNCIICHGQAGNSMGTMPNLQRMAPATHRIFREIVHGGGLEPLGMPGFAERLSEEEVALIHAYLVSRIRMAAGEP